MMLSMKTEYALRAIHAISGQPGSLKRSEISNSQKIPHSFLKNILVDLRNAGLIETQKGPGGGYRLARKKEQITVWDIYQAVDYRPCQGRRCFPAMHEECEHFESCNLKGVWFRLNEVIHDTLSTMTLANISQLDHSYYSTPELTNQGGLHA